MIETADNKQKLHLEEILYITLNQFTFKILQKKNLQKTGIQWQSL